MCSGDYIVNIDADEIPHEIFIKQIKQVLEIKDFSGGLNCSVDSRDIKINEFSQLYNISSSQEGILYFDNTSNKLKVWDGSAWADATSAVDGVMNTTEVSGSGSTGATPNHWYAFVHDASLQTVYLNGIRLIANQDYRSVNSNSSTSHMSSGTASHIYFVSATEDSDVISMTALGTVSAISVVPAGGGTFTGDVSLDTDSKLKQKGAFMQSSTHQAMVVGG